jgi:hypothetical protein
MSRVLTLRSCVMALAGLLWLLPMTACSGKHESREPEGREAVESEEHGEAGHDSAEDDETGHDDEAIHPSPEAGTVARAQEPEAPVKTLQPSTPAKSEAPESSAAPKSPSPPEGIIAVPATKPGLTRVGAEKCKLCHRLQYDSWAATAHAARTPPLDCESCHGPGSEYKTISIMKDAEKARAAGLVIPEKSFCTENCHANKWKDDMLERAHAHKVKTVEG